MPGANTRAMEKARGIDCDGIIFDLEDAVAPEAKALARAQVDAAVGAGGYGHRELVVRANDGALGRDMGFDGKTLIHPAQVDIANAVFGPSSEEVDLAQRVAGAWSSARKAGLGVVEVDGRLVEHMHAAQAERTLALARALAARG